MSLSLKSPSRDISLKQFWDICCLKTGSLIKICSLPRLIESHDVVSAFYDRCDPGYLQLFLDDLFDVKADTSDGILNTFHLIAIRQGLIAEFVLSHEHSRERLPVNDELAMDISILGHGFLVDHREMGSDASRESDIRAALENLCSDAVLSIEELARLAVSRADSVRRTLDARDTRGCQYALWEAGIYLKFNNIFALDQAYVLGVAPAILRGKARWLPLGLRLYLGALGVKIRIERYFRGG